MRTNISLGGVTLESLEQRKLMTAGGTTMLPAITVLFREPTAKLRDGVLYVKGSQDSDNIIADIIPKTATSPALLNFGGADEIVSGQSAYGFINTLSPAGPTFILADVKKIIVDAGSGNDKVDLSTLDIPSVIYGGAGNDTLLGTAANDTIYGDNGNDAITDGAGNDLLVGGNGNDTLRAHAGIDTLLGQGGNDQLVSYSTNEDVLSGGAGSDTGSIFNGAPDAISGFETLDGAAPVSNIGNASSFTLRRDNGQLFLDASVTLAGNSFSIDWDLVTDSDSHVVVDAKLYVGKTAIAGSTTTTYTHTFQLNDSVKAHELEVSLEQSGKPVLDKSFLVSPAFAQQTATFGGSANGGEVIKLLPADTTF